MSKLYLIKEGEISLKGGNRDLFEKRLRHNIKDKIKPYKSEMKRQKGRLYAYFDDDCPDDMAEKALSTTFGLTGFAKAEKAEKSIEGIKKKCAEVALKSFGKEGTFRISVRREDKSFPLNSHGVAVSVASVVHEILPGLTVNLTNPDYTLNIEIRNDVYIYTDEVKGAGGLPVGTAGRGLLLLSGGIDSPVAAYLMASRGMKTDALYFHAYPYTSDLALEKVKTLSSLIAPYNQGMRLFVIPFTEGQLHIKKHARENETTLMFRAAMMRSAEKIAAYASCSAIITGEALSQVASQTVEAMAFTTSMTNLPVLRPLVGLEKGEIIERAKKIGTYGTSILPYEDCCVIFSPKHPVTKPDKEESVKHYEELGMDPIIDAAINNMKVYRFDPLGREYEEDR